MQTLIYGANATNAVWYVPGSHMVGTIDIAARVKAGGGTDRLPDAVPAIAEPGSVVVFSRNVRQAPWVLVFPTHVVFR